jgi:predicted DNA-binding WGR domain protein
MTPPSVQQLALVLTDAPEPLPEAVVAAGPSIAAVVRFDQYVRLLSLDPVRNRYRFYSLTWQPGLWGGGALVRAWGRLGTPGRSVTAFYPDRHAADSAIRALLRRRLRHGYRVVGWR